MESVYRVTVSTPRRVSGTESDFVFDVAGVNTGRDFVQGAWICAVEWITPVTFEDSETRCLLLTCPSMAQPSSSETWSNGNPSSTLAALQRNGNDPVYGFAIDTPYVRKSTLGVHVRGDALNNGRLRFRMLAITEASFPEVSGVRPADSIQLPYQFSLVFWHTDTVPDVPPPMASGDFRLWVHSANRIAGNAHDALLPVPSWVRFDGDDWMVAATMAGAVRVKNLDGPTAVALVCSNVRDETGEPSTLLLLHRYEQYGTGDDAFVTYGQTLSIKPTSRDTVGHPLRGQQVLSGGTMALRLVAADGSNNVVNAQDWAACIHFYKSS